MTLDLEFGTQHVEVFEDVTVAVSRDMIWSIRISMSGKMIAGGSCRDLQASVRESMTSAFGAIWMANYLGRSDIESSLRDAVAWLGGLLEEPGGYRQ